MLILPLLMMLRAIITPRHALLMPHVRSILLRHADDAAVITYTPH